MLSCLTEFDMIRSEPCHFCCNSNALYSENPTADGLELWSDTSHCSCKSLPAKPSAASCLLSPARPMIRSSLCAQGACCTHPSLPSVPSLSPCAAFAFPGHSLPRKPFHNAGTKGRRRWPFEIVNVTCDNRRQFAVACPSLSLIHTYM